MRAFQKRITAAFLKNCSSDKAYDWLLAMAPAAARARNKFWAKVDAQREHRVLEYILLRRRHPLIDIGLAQYARTPYVLRTVFARGGSGIRCAVLANPFLFEATFLNDRTVADIPAIVRRADRRELEALALNPYLPDGFYESLIAREAYFADLDDPMYKFMLYHLGDNPRLSATYDDTRLDGMDDYLFHKVFTAAWGLTTQVPVTQEWAGILFHLLHQAQEPRSFQEVAQAIDRWRIDPPKGEDDAHYIAGYGFDVRSRLADLLKADDNLLNSSDLALRSSFYRRFSPYRYENWPELLQRDGEDFVENAIRNVGLWKDTKERERLRRLAWDTPDPLHDMMMPNTFRARERFLRDQHPEWFRADDGDARGDPDAATVATEDVLKSILEKLDALSAEQRARRWWR